MMAYEINTCLSGSFSLEKPGKKGQNDHLFVLPVFVADYIDHFPGSVV